eukprot:TRINITY_DN14210_c0_g1_i1.p1 TRINITY_DN14210_c0_g1~~TRINITY_DN14210_c0_g1_i1.p1  ORF type:complete len:260 (+),score=7.25 TRINITY_DN14210_c0_g1_i1:232-1011(+)
MRYCHFHLFLILFQLLLFAWTARSISTSSTLTEWRPARATYYATDNPPDSVGGACGYGDLERGGYGKATAGLSAELFDRGRVCGACFEIRCVDDVKWCIRGRSVIVTATNFCPPNYGLPSDGGGHCNPPNRHLVLHVEAFQKIAIWKASNMPVQYRRIKCIKDGGIRFTIDGVGYFHSVLISNVAGAGDIVAVKIKGSRTGWLQMGRNWGQIWHINADLKNQPLSFEVTSSDDKIVTSYSVAPKVWNFGQTFVGQQFQS